ncbi:hypothetical protein FGO68_gene4736 [Halteria grandinella]|uniref:Uncharacterized protein n=1 Tax=Halteria grandinella TaxID=5974 RepID=A0A8J8T741_HALGN|nr:hypothetical protein FGO68_gene4736 [Halteria grandinella]
MQISTDLLRPKCLISEEQQEQLKLQRTYKYLQISSWKHNPYITHSATSTKRFEAPWTATHSFLDPYGAKPCKSTCKYHQSEHHQLSLLIQKVTTLSEKEASHQSLRLLHMQGYPTHSHFQTFHQIKLAPTCKHITLMQRGINFLESRLFTIEQPFSKILFPICISQNSNHQKQTIQDQVLRLQAQFKPTKHQIAHTDLMIAFHQPNVYLVNIHQSLLFRYHSQSGQFEIIS